MIKVNGLDVNMEIKPLSTDVITKIRCASNINNLTQCVTELVLNSLDANSSAVAVRLNSVSFRIQVIDNGTGITQENLEKVAQKYSTNKCQSLADIDKKLKTYGYKGESLWTISNISKTLNITSRYTNSDKTYSKNISARKHGKVTLAKNRQSVGTTITVYGFFYHLPVRLKQTKKEFEFEEIVDFVKRISIIQPQISITLRDDINGKLLFKRSKSENIIESLAGIYPDVKYDETVVMKIHKDKITVEALLSRNIFKDKVIQLLYVNKRPVHHQKLQSFICRELIKEKKDRLESGYGLNPMFIFNIKCSISNLNVIYENSQAKVEFLNIDLVYRCVDKLILNFFGKSKTTKPDMELHENRKSVCGVSDLVGTVKGFGFKDWLKKDERNEGASGVIEDVVEDQAEIEKPTRKQKTICEVKKNKLKSLPIKIYEQHNEMARKVKINGNNTKKGEFADYREKDLQDKNKFNPPETLRKNYRILEKNRKNIECKDLQDANKITRSATPNENVAEKVMTENYRSLQKNRRNKTCKDILDRNELIPPSTPNEYFVEKVMMKNYRTLEQSYRNVTCKDLQAKNKFVPPGAPNEQFVEKVMMENYRRLQNNCKDIMSKHDETLFSHFTGTEEKGKDLIMYMFLKSTELFNENTPTTQVSEENSCGQLDSSRETIMESNYFFENVTKTRTHQLNKTISVSVRLKRRKNVEFSENYSFSFPANKKRRIEHLNQAANLRGKGNITSPYFKKKDKGYGPKKNVVDKQIQACLTGNFKDNSTKRLSSMRMWNPLINDKKMKEGIFCTKQFGDEDIANSIFNSYLVKNNNLNHGIMRTCFDQISVFNDYFSNFKKQEQELLCDSNKPYLFNFETAGLITNPGFENNLRSNDENDPRNQLTSNNRKYDSNNNVSFDFGNLSLSPIPKIKEKPAQKLQNVGLKMLEPVFSKPSKRNIKKFKRYASEGEYLKMSSPYFSKEKFKHRSKNYDNFPFTPINKLPQNKIPRSAEKFRRYHTEPLEDASFQYIQNVKKNIDKIFMAWKGEKVPYRNNNKVELISNVRESEIYTKDSLEPENDKHNNLRREIHKNETSSPLWKKFIKNKTFKMRDNFRKTSHFGGKRVDFKVQQKKSNYFERKSSSVSEDIIGESPDLFSNVKLTAINESCTKTVRDLSFMPNSAISFDIDGVLNDRNVDTEKDLTTLTAVGTVKSSNLIITLDMEHENGWKTDAITEGGVCSASLAKEDWTKKLDQDGKEFYFNKKTGITSFLFPKKEELYNFKQRPEFMPKGLSPLLIPNNELEKSLSPVSKEKLHDEILKSYVDDLGLIKWEKCIKGHDPKKFFENLYNRKVNEYEKEIPNVIETRMPKFASTSEHKFSRDIFSGLRVIGQIDQKFIATIDKKKFDLILFDQHAVHERIRLEELLKEYHGKSAACQNITLFMKQPDVELMKNHEKYLNGIGFRYQFLKNGITVYEVPPCFFNKVTKEYTLSKLVQQFVRELLVFVKDTRGVLTGLPRMINQIINMEACRGSVKFGELLARKEMEKLIENLSHCTLPFQCAHGRPTLIPLMKLNDIAEIVHKPNLCCLRKT